MPLKRRKPTTKGRQSNHSLAANGVGQSNLSVIYIKQGEHCWNVSSRSNQLLGSFLSHRRAVIYARQVVG